MINPALFISWTELYLGRWGFIPVCVHGPWDMCREDLRNIGLKNRKSYMWLQSNSHNMRPTQISQSAVLFYLMCPTFNYPSRKFKINYGRMDRVWCEKDCNFRPWVPFLVPSCFVRLRKSLISKPLFSRFKKPILFFCLDVASFVREVGESFSECQQTRMSHQWLTNGKLPSRPNGTRSK